MQKKISFEEAAILDAFNKAAGNAREGIMEEAHSLVKCLYSEAIPREAPITMLMVGFLMGMEEGMKLEAAIEGRV